MFKLAQGEYVAPERVENVYLTSPLINFIFVEGNSLHPFTVGVVVPSWTALRERLLQQSDTNIGWSKSNQLTEGELCTDERVNNLLLTELQAVGKRGGLKGFEQVRFCTCSCLNVKKQCMLLLLDKLVRFF